MNPTVDDKGREHDVRPWGEYLVLEDDAHDHKVKRITVAPHGRLSYQSHARRAEHWFVVDGTAHVTLDDAVVEVGPGESIDIAVGAKHRVENRGETPLVFIEVQHGTYFGEDDIVRYEDDYGRSDA
jgi:mannose-6-phosphate isomerase